MQFLELSGFDRCNFLKHSFVFGFCVRAKMGMAMAVRAYADHEAWVVRTTIAQAANMVCFQKRCTVWCCEWRRLIAAFTLSVRTRQNVVTQSTATFIHCAARSCLALPRGHIRGRIGKVTKPGQVSSISLDRLVVYSIYDCVKSPKFKHYNITDIVISVRHFFYAMTLVNVKTVESNFAFFDLREMEKFLPVFRVLQNRSVSSVKLLITGSSLASILKNTIWAHQVTVAMLSATGCRNEEYWSAIGRNDAGLRVATKDRMNITAAIVGAPLNKPQIHNLILLYQCVRLIVALKQSCVEQQCQGGIPKSVALGGTGGGRSAQDRPEISFSPSEKVQA